VAAEGRAPEWRHASGLTQRLFAGLRISIPQGIRLGILSAQVCASTSLLCASPFCARARAIAGADGACQEWGRASTYPWPAFSASRALYYC
jgi:hypothetical protein